MDEKNISVLSGRDARSDEKSAPAVTSQVCERCGGEGKLYASRYGGNDPDVWPIGECPVCEGSGYEVIETEPVDEEEIMMADELKRVATISFCEGLLDINLSGCGDKDGAGRISFTDNDLDWGHGEDSHWRFMRLPKSELEAIRDFLNQHLPAPEENRS